MRPVCAPSPALTFKPLISGTLQLLVAKLAENGSSKVRKATFKNAFCFRFS
jgi:hypothetical protein